MLPTFVWIDNDFLNFSSGLRHFRQPTVFSKLSFQTLRLDRRQWRHLGQFIVGHLNTHQFLNQLSSFKFFLLFVDNFFKFLSLLFWQNFCRVVGRLGLNEGPLGCRQHERIACIVTTCLKKIAKTTDLSLAMVTYVMVLTYLSIWIDRKSIVWDSSCSIHW